MGLSQIDQFDGIEYCAGEFFIVSIVSRLVQNFGWTPVGKQLEFEMLEASSHTLVGEHFNCKISTLYSNELARIHLEEPIRLFDNDLWTIDAFSRHSGYDFYHMVFGHIAIDISTGGREGGDSRFASGLIRVNRRLAI